jgi:hypothetical protein
VYSLKLNERRVICLGDKMLELLTSHTVLLLSIGELSDKTACILYRNQCKQFVNMNFSESV